jgi:hypothetical protein
MMANTLTETGRAALLTGTASWATGKGASGTIQAALVTTGSFTTGIKAITGATVATPCVVTATSHGFTNGDVVVISGVGGTLTANGVFQIASVATNTFALTDYVTGLNIVGLGAYTSGGVAVNLGPSASGATWASFSANLVGSGVALTSLTETGLGTGGAGLTAWTETDGTANAATVTFSAVSGSVVSGVMLLATASSVSGTLAGTDIPIAWIDGQMIVTAASIVTAGTTLYVERLPAPIANGTVLSFGDGNPATMTALANQYARQLTVSSYTNTVAGYRATAPATGSGLPVTPNGGNISITWDANQYKIFKL